MNTSHMKGFSNYSIQIGNPTVEHNSPLYHIHFEYLVSSAKKMLAGLQDQPTRTFHSHADLYRVRGQCDYTTDKDTCKAGCLRRLKLHTSKSRCIAMT